MSEDPQWRSDADEEEWIRQQVAAERAARRDAGSEQARAWQAEAQETTDELAARLLLLATLKGAVEQSERHTKELLAGRLTVGDLKRPEISGVSAGSVTYAHGGATVTVTDEQTLAEWLLDHYATEVEMQYRIRPAFLEQIKEASKAAGQPAGPGGELGLPGLSVRDGMPRIVARPDRAHASELWLAARANPLRLITSKEPT